jgi:hypothetical protein
MRAGVRSSSVAGEIQPSHGGSGSSGGFANEEPGCGRYLFVVTGGVGVAIVATPFSADAEVDDRGFFVKCGCQIVVEDKFIASVTG